MFVVQLNMLRIIERHDILTLAGEQLPGAAVEAVNQTLMELRDKAASALGNVVNAPQAEIDSRVLIEPATRVSRIAAEGAIYVSSSLIPLKHFDTKQTQAGVTFQPVRGKSKTIPGAFGPDIARLGKQPWRRVGKKRLPIEKVPGFSMAKSTTVMETVRRVASEANEILMRNIDAQVKRFLGNLESGRTTFEPTYINRTRGQWLGWGRYRSVVTTTGRKR